MAYSDKVIDHYENPRNVGKFDPAQANIGTGMVGAPACGDVMRLQIDRKTITESSRTLNSKPTAVDQQSHLPHS